MLKTLKQFLQETTVPPEYQHIADNWNHHAEVDGDTQFKISNAMDKGSFTHFPLDSGMLDADPDVVEHLNNHGWDVKDYQKGIAHKKTQVGNPAMGIPMREKIVEKKIGSILDETNASPDVKKAFTNERGQVNAAQQHVVVSTSPLAILGMSTGTNWDDQSCMNLVNGSNSHYMRHDSEHGTHIAYLVNSDDTTAFKYGEPEKPIARIALKPHHHEDYDTGERDTIFRPEADTYGSGSTAFSRAVSAWAVKNYPAIKNARYEKNENVYDDTGNNVYESIDKDRIEKSLNNGGKIVDTGTAIDDEVINHGINHLINSAKDRQDRSEYLTPRINALSNIANLSTSHVAKLHKLAGEATFLDGESATNRLRRGLAIYHGDKFSTNALNELWNSDEDKTLFPVKAITSTKLPDNILDQLPINRYEFVRQQKIKDHHIDKVVDAYNENEIGAAPVLRHFKARLNSDHINTLIDGQKYTEKLKDVFHIVNSSDAFSKDHHDKIMKRLNNVSDLSAADSVKSAIARESRHATFDDFKDKLGHLMANTNLPEEENVKIKNEVMNRVMNHVHVKNSQWESDNPTFSHVSGVSMQFSPNLIPEHISKHMTDEDYNNLASKRFDVNFENSEHSNKYLNKLFGHAANIDDALNDHIQHKMDTEDEYDPDEDDHVQKMKDNLHLHMEAYANNIGNHINDHVEDSDGNLKDEKELLKTEDRLSGIGKTTLSYLDHYMSPHNSNSWDDHEHYNDNFLEHEERLNRLRGGNNDY